VVEFEQGVEGYEVLVVGGRLGRREIGFGRNLSMREGIVSYACPISIFYLFAAGTRR
jgi:hypothetical protein